MQGKECLANSWEKYYNSDYQYISPKRNDVIIRHKGSFYIIQTCFFDHTCGAIRINNTDSESKLLVESVTFTNCSISGDNNGGCLLFESLGSCVQSKISSTKSMVGTWNNGGHHSYVVTFKDEKYLNFVEDSSLYSCGFHSLGCGPIYHYNGLMHITSLNTTYNSCYKYSGFIITCPAIQSNVTFCTICNDFTSEIITTDFVEGVNYVDHCNINNNTCPEDSFYGTITVDYSAILTMKSSCIMNNIAKYLFYANSGFIKLINCSCDNSSSTFNNVDASLIGNQSFTNDLFPFVNSNCQSFQKTKLGFPFLISKSLGNQIHLYISLVVYTI